MNVAVQSFDQQVPRIENIVILDDAQFDHLALKRSAARCDFVGQVQSFYSAEDLLDTLAHPDQPEIDVLIVDQFMPRMGGIEFLSIAKDRNPRGIARLIYLALTVPPDTAWIEGLMKRGLCDDWVEKPMTPQTLYAIAERLAGTSDAIKRLRGAT